MSADPHFAIEQSQEWLAVEANAGTSSTISCEPCRHKKRKCDRLLPVCTLCTTSGTQCQYPERGKRGMPIGYITQLEERLNEVETALFRLHADHELYKAGRPALGPEFQRTLKGIADHYASQSKQEKINAWQQQDLSEEAGRSRWWQATNRLTGFNLDIPASTHFRPDDDAPAFLSSTIIESSITDIMNRIPMDERHKYF